MNDVPFPNISEPVSSKSGIWSHVWLRFLQDIFKRVESSEGDSMMLFPIGESTSSRQVDEILIDSSINDRSSLPNPVYDDYIMFSHNHDSSSRDADTDAIVHSSVPDSNTQGAEDVGIIALMEV